MKITLVLCVLDVTQRTIGPQQADDADYWGPVAGVDAGVSGRELREGCGSTVSGSI